MIEVCVLRKDEFATAPTTTVRATADETTINGDVDLQKCLKCLNYAKITNFKVIDFYSRFETTTKTLKKILLFKRSEKLSYFYAIGILTYSIRLRKISKRKWSRHKKVNFNQF